MYPVAYFNDEPVELKPCTLDKFGTNYIVFQNLIILLDLS